MVDGIFFLNENHEEVTGSKLKISGLCVLQLLLSEHLAHLDPLDFTSA